MDTVLGLWYDITDGRWKLGNPNAPGFGVPDDWPEIKGIKLIRGSMGEIGAVPNGVTLCTMSASGAVPSMTIMLSPDHGDVANLIFPQVFAYVPTTNWACVGYYNSTAGTENVGPANFGIVGAEWA